MIHWIDSSVLIQSRHKYHTRERVPQFWSWLDEQLARGTIKMPHRVFQEVTKGNDWLVGWCRARRNQGLDVPCTSSVEEEYRTLATFVQNKYQHAPHQIREYLSGADGWLIAHAMSTKGVVVSEEDKARKHETSSIKIPNLCKTPGKVHWVDTFGMLDALKANFSHRK